MLDETAVGEEEQGNALTEEQAIKFLREKGYESISKEQVLTQDEKVNSLLQEFPFTPAEGMDEEAVAKAQEDYAMRVQNTYLKNEKALSAEFKDASDTQIFKAVKAVMSSDVGAAAKTFSALVKNKLSKEKQNEEENTENLHVETESKGSGGFAPTGMNFGDGSLLEASFQSRT